MRSFYGLIRLLFLIVLLHLWFKYQNETFLCLDKVNKTFISCYLALLMASETKTAKFP